MTLTDYYVVLGVASDATIADIKKAFRSRATKLHPDTGRGDDMKFIELRKAYEAILHDRKTNPTRIRQTPTLVTQSGTQTATMYDPFADPDYHSRQFFTVDNPRAEGFERKIRAQGCVHCHGMGTITKNTDPRRGYMGLETCLCKCQWV